jgi:transcriptional regulator with XRE-family HTH domain
MPIDRLKIKDLRTAKGWTQQKCAEAVGFSNRQVWYQLESGALENITVATLDKIAQLFGVSAKDLLK